MKACRKCGIDKEAEAFHSDKSRPDGRFPYCRECCKADKATQRDKNGAAIRARDNERYAASPDRKAACKLRAKEWRWRNPDYFRAHVTRYRSRVRGAELTEHIDPDYVYERDGFRCHICEKHVRDGERTLDHLVPLSKGGNHMLANVRLAHRGCNSSRGAGRLPAQLILVG